MFGTNKINTFNCWEYDFKMFPKKGLVQGRMYLMGEPRSKELFSVVVR